MLMICWFYCVPFARGLFFASSGLLFLFSLFVLKRGIRQSRTGLRQAAFLLMFLAALKIFTVDIYLLREKILCGTGLFPSGCTATGFKILLLSGLAAAALSSLAIFNAYRGFLRDRRQASVTPEQARLTLWANLSLSLVVILALWLAAPWVGYLTVGHAPGLFMRVPWQHLAVLNIVVLLTGFWKLEDCNWIYQPEERLKKKHLTRVWTARDTLWLSVILFLIALVFSYVSNDVLSEAGSRNPEAGRRFQMDRLDFSGPGGGFHLPGN